MQHGALSSAFAAATDGQLPVLHPWHLPAAQRAASPASSSPTSVDGDRAEDTEHATTAAPSQPSPGQTRLGTVHSGLLSPARSEDPSGDFARLLSLDLSPSGRVGASPQRRPSGTLRSADAARQPASDGGNAEGSKSEQMGASARDVTVLLTVHPDDSMAWVTVELVAARKARHAGQPRHADNSPAEHQAVRDETTAASAPEAADPAAQAGGAAAPPVDDWVAALPAVPKLPIRLDTVAAATNSPRGATAAEPSYADITAQLAGSITDASSSSDGPDDDDDEEEEESEPAASEDEADRERDPRRELELDTAVADALTQV